MPRRVKEEERIEMIIRGLLKEPDNRRCINCNSLGPQYVCTTFWTFICTNCSGVHREFTHRVKSVSMAKFNEEEIAALQAGGNERAKEIYFKTWDPQRNNYPDGSNLHKLREFVKHVYLDRRYAGENNSNKLSMIKLNNPFELRSVEKSSRGTRDGGFLERSSFERASNSGSDDFNERSLSFDKYSPAKRNNGRSFKDLLEERSPHSSRSSRPTTRFEIVDDRFRDDGNVKHFERHLSRESRGKSLPVIRPLKDIVGEKAPALKIDGPPRANDWKKEDVASAKGQKLADSTTSGSSSVQPKQDNKVNSSSLIDFDAMPEPTSNATEPQANVTASKTNNESSSVESSVTQVATNAPNMNSLESLLLDWSDSKASPSAGAGGPQPSTLKADDVGITKAPDLSDSIGALAITTTENEQNQTNQQQSKAPAPNELRPAQSVQLAQSSQASNPGDGSGPGGARKEIPQDLFSSNLTPFNSSVASWQMHPPYGRGYGLQFHPPAMHAAAFPNPQRPQNPFDIGDDRFQSQALPSQPSPYANALPSHVAPYEMNMPPVPGAYIGQLQNNMPLTRPQGITDLGRSEDAFSSLNPIQPQASGMDSLPASHNSPVSRLGNPFG